MKAYPIGRDVLDQMEKDSGHSIELSPSTVYLTVGGTVWYALLPAKDAA